MHLSGIMPSNLKSLIFKSPDNCVIVVLAFLVMIQESIVSSSSVTTKSPESVHNSCVP